MRKIASFFVMLFITTNCFSQNDHQIDSLKKLLATPKEDTVTATRYIELALLALLEDSSLSYLNRAYDLSRKLSWKRGEARSLVYRGFFFGVTGNEVRGLGDLLDAIPISEDLNDSSLLARCLNGLGLLYLTTEDYHRSLHYLNRGHSVAKALGDNRSIFATATNMGDLYVRTENADSALFYNNVCYQIANTSKDENQLAWSFKGLGATHFLLKNYDLAFTYLYKGLDLAKPSKVNSAVLAFNYPIEDMLHIPLFLGNKEPADLFMHQSKKLSSLKATENCRKVFLSWCRLLLIL